RRLLNPAAPRQLNHSYTTTTTWPFGDRRPVRSTRIGTLAGALVCLCASLACAPIVRAPDFEGAHDRSTEASLLGPFDGQVVDGSTTEPISGATVLAIWTYDEGRGFVGAGGSVTR